FEIIDVLLTIEHCYINQLSALDIDDEIDLEKDKNDKEINDSTIKNSSYFSWTRLLELKDAITWLATMLALKKGKENKKD
ncbi:26428_t:CDS:2, partial [Gigaspora margarita]